MIYDRVPGSTEEAMLMLELLENDRVLSYGFSRFVFACMMDLNVGCEGLGR